MSTNYIAPTWRMPRNANNTPVNKLSNYSINFDGNQYVIIGSSTELDNAPSNPYSFSFWFKSSTAGDVLSEKRAVNNLLNAQYTIHLESGYIKWYGGADGITAGTQTSTTLIDDQWHHIVCVAESTTVNKIYVDGQLDVTSSADRINSAAVAGTFNIGANYVGSYRFVGQLSQYCIFDYALTDGTAGTVDQISYLYNLNNPMAIDGAEPIAYWPLGDNSNPIATAGYPNISVGADSVFDFNGGDDKIPLPQGSLQLVTSISISAWIKTTTTGTRQTIISNDNVSSGSSNAGRSWNFLVNGQNVDFILRPENDPVPAGTTFNTITTSGVNVADDNWHNVVALWDGTTNTNSQKVFVDGILRAQGTPSFTQPMRQRESNAPTIGEQVGQTAFWDWEGEMSNIQIWEAGLTYGTVSSLGDTAGGEVAELYNNGQPLMTGTQPQAANLKVWYKLNQTANWEADTVGEWQIPDAVSAFPQCFEFDGIADKVTIPKGSMSDDESRSVSIWIKNEITSGTDYVFNSRAGGGTTNGITLIQTTTSGYIINNSNGCKIATGYLSDLNIPNDGKWHHIAWTAFLATQGLKVYIDGVFVYEFIGTTTVDTLPSTDITVGATSSPWTGKLSNFQIWDDVVLSDGGVALNDPAGGQIAELFNNGTPLTTAIESSNMKVWCKFDSTALWYPASGIWGFPNAVEPGSPIVNFSN